MKKCILFLAVCLLFLTGIRADAASLSVKNQHVNKGETFIRHFSGSSEKKPKWKTSNPKVAGISKVDDQTCRVEGLKKGKCKIKCRVGNKTYVCKVRVDNPKMKSKLEIYEDSSKVLSIKGLTKGAKVSWWYDTGTSLIKVKKKRASHKITMTGLTEGAIRVYALVNGKTFVCNVNVKHICSKHSDWIIVSRPSANRSGVKRKYCTVCDKTLLTKTITKAEDVRVADVIKWAVSNIGITRYSMSNRGAGLDKDGHIIATDCSGFVWWCYRKMGLHEDIPMWCTGNMGQYFYPVNPANAKPGDVLFITAMERHSSVGHARLYIGKGMTVECTSGGSGGVRYKKIDLDNLQGYHFGRIYPQYIQ